MHALTRRQFLSLSLKLAVVTGLGSTAVPKICQALEQMASGQAPVVWLQGQSCSGCSVSLLNSSHPDPVALLMHQIALQFHGTLSTATGELAMTVLNTTVQKGGYYLAVEGSVPAGMPEACVIGHEPFGEQLVRAAQAAKAILAVGSCACFGGIPAAENNPTGAISVVDHLQRHKITTPLIRIPGCPTHPDWIVGTLVHLLKFGLPELNEELCPTVFFGRLLHDQCPRFADYERENFARTFSEPGCLFKLGCLGPITHSDCTTRHWNSGTSNCIKAGAPCIGCTGKAFAHQASFPFYRKGEEVAKEKNAV